MLNQGEILERIFSGNTSTIKKFIKVQYEPRISLPIDFYFLDQHHEILEVINQKKYSRFTTSYLVRTDKGIYSLKFYFLNMQLGKFDFIKGFWKLDFKVIET